MPRYIHAKKVHMVVSDDDPWVKIDEAEGIAAYYHAELTVIHKAGHINDDSGYGKWELIETLVVDKNDISYNRRVGSPTTK